MTIATPKGISDMFFNRKKINDINTDAQAILKSTVARFHAERSAHHAEMTRLEAVIRKATADYNQHVQIFDACTDMLYSLIEKPAEDEAKALASIETAMEEIEFDFNETVEAHDEECYPTTEAHDAFRVTCTEIDGPDAAPEVEVIAGRDATVFIHNKKTGQPRRAAHRLS